MLLSRLWGKFEGLRQIWQFDNRWQLITSRVLFPREPINIYRMGDVRFLSDHSAGDSNGARDVIASSMYKKIIHVMTLSSPLKVFDLGANNGGFPLLLKTLGCDLEQTVCVEMNPNTFSRLRFNVESNLRGVVLYNAAVCGRERDLELHLGTGGTGDTIYQDGHSVAAAQAVKIRGRTFDDLFANAFGDQVVDICKMDIEGAEYEVFAAPDHKALARCRYLIIEIHDGQGREPEQIVTRLRSIGFVELPGVREAGAAVYGFKNSALE